MTTYSYAQLEGLWEQAGGSKALAPVMAAIAMAESDGNSNAYNPSGATGLWQILGAVHASDQGSLTNPQVNAREAVLKYQSQGLGAWTTYTSGAYKRYLRGNVPASANASAPSSASSGGTGGATYSSLGVGSVLSGASGLLKDVATVLDYAFGMFGRGQGWRLAFTLVAAVALIGSWKILAGPGAGPHIPKVVPIPI